MDKKRSHIRRAWDWTSRGHTAWGLLELIGGPKVVVGFFAAALAGTIAKIQVVGPLGVFFAILGGLALGAIVGDRVSAWHQRKSVATKVGTEPEIRVLEQARPEGDHLREQLGILYRSVADSAYNQAHELLGRTAQGLRDTEGNLARQEVGVLLNRYVMEADRAARTKLAPALDSDAAPIDDSEHLQDLFGEYFEKYQHLAEWIDRTGRLIDFPEFMGAPDYWRWREVDREFLQRLRDLIAVSEFSRLRQHVLRVGWGEEFRPTL